jgi:hypothetical protein
MRREDERRVHVELDGSTNSAGYTHDGSDRAAAPSFCPTGWPDCVAEVHRHAEDMSIAILEVHLENRWSTWLR